MAKVGTFLTIFTAVGWLFGKFGMYRELAYPVILDVIPWGFTLGVAILLTSSLLAIIYAPSSLKQIEAEFYPQYRDFSNH